MFFLLLMFLFNVLLIAEEIVEVAVVFIFFRINYFLQLRLSLSGGFEKGKNFYA